MKYKEWILITIFLSKSKGRKNKKEESNSESDDGLYDNDFDPKNPFGGDEIESFNKNRDKVNLSFIIDYKKLMKKWKLIR